MISYKKYPVENDHTRCFRYASEVGRGFSFRSDIEFLRSFLVQAGAQMDFIKKSINCDDPFYIPFKPDDKKFEVVKYNAMNWFKDDFFCFELFNGCNPYTIRIVKPEELRTEFHQLLDANSKPVDLNQYKFLLLNEYTELRDFCYPNNKTAD